MTGNQTLSPMVSLNDYLDQLLAALAAPEALIVGTFDAVGLVLSADVYSVADVPRENAAACEGMAVRASDLATAALQQPVVVSTSGMPAEPAAHHFAVGQVVAQGDPLPYGFDAVLPLTKRSLKEPRVVVTGPIGAGTNVTTVGSDIAQNQLLALAGHIVTPADVALFTSAGVDRVQCVPAPRIVIVSVMPDDSAQGEQTRAVAMMTAAAVRALGAMVFLGGETFATRDALAQALDANLGRADLIILVGGNQVQIAPRVSAVLASLGSAVGATVSTQGLETQLFGHVGTCPVVAVSSLPGPAQRTFEYVLRPAVRQLQGRRDGVRPIVQAKATAALDADTVVDRLIAVRLTRVAGEWHAEPFADAPHSSVIVAQTDGYVRVPGGSGGYQNGSAVTVDLVTD